MDQHAAVHVERDACAVFGKVASKKHNTTGDIVRLTDGYAAAEYDTSLSGDATTKSIALQPGDEVSLGTEYANGGTVGSTYRYTGAAATLDLAAIDYSTGAWVKVGGEAGRMGGMVQPADCRTACPGPTAPPSVSLREPPSPARGEGRKHRAHRLSP